MRALSRRATPSKQPAPGIERALDIGLGPVLAHVGGHAGATLDPLFTDRIRASDLTARALTAAKYDTLSELLIAARSLECRVVLLTGAATALRY